MPLVSRTLPGLYGGVSQQPPTLRLENQVEIQENAMSLLVDGLVKRPNTEFVTNLSSAVSNKSLVHLINRDLNERYLVIFTGNSNEPIEIFTLDGVKCTVLYDSNTKSYVTSSSPIDDIQCVTVADYTIVVNKTKIPKMKTPAPVSKVYTNLIYIKRGIPDTSYTVQVIVNNTAIVTVKHETDSPDTGQTYVRTTDIAQAIKDGLASGLTDSEWKVSLVGSTIIVKNTVKDFYIKVSDSYGNDAMFSIKNKVQKFSDLPPAAEDGTIIAVEGDDVSNFDNFYVKYQENDEGVGYWEETHSLFDSKGNPLATEFDPSTMPHRLIRSGANEFTLKPIEWEPRRVGDDESAPEPSFIGNKISDVFFFKNRLGFLSGENIIMSRASDYFNFWPSTVTDVLDGDPIDVAVATTQVANLNHAVPFSSTLLLFSDQMQFMLSSGDSLLTPTSVAIDPSTYFETSKKCTPVGAGPNVYFVVPNGEYSAVREYYVQADTKTNDAQDVTAHVPRYLPRNISSMVSSSANDIIFLFSPDKPKHLYAYKYFWQGDEKVQSAWFAWTFEDNIIAMAILENYLYLIMETSGNKFLCKVDLQRAATDALDFKVHLDKLVRVKGVYDADTNTTTWTLPYQDPSDNFIVVESLDGNQILTVSKISNNQLTCLGDYSNMNCYIGKLYTMRVRLSRWYLRNQNGLANTQGRLQIRTLTLSYSDTGYFKVETLKSRKVITGAQVGVSRIGRPTLLNGEARFPILSNTSNTHIDIVSDSYLPCKIQSASYEGFWTSRSVSF